MKRFASIALALSILAFAAPARAEAYPLWIAGVQFTSDNLVIDGTDNPEITSGTATFDPASNTLSLTNFVYSGAGHLWTANPGTENEHTSAACIFYSGADALAVSLSGTNSVALSAANPAPYSSYGFRSGNYKTAVSFAGSGSLSARAGAAENSSYGVDVHGPLAVAAGAEVAGAAGAAPSSGGVAAFGRIEVGGRLAGTGGASSNTSEGIACYTMGTSEIVVSEGASVAAAGGAARLSYGILAKTLTVNGGEATAEGGEASSHSRALYPPSGNVALAVADGWQVLAGEDADSAALVAGDGWKDQKYVRIAAPPSVSGVEAAASDPWDGTVALSFTVAGDPAAACPAWNAPYLSIVATDNETGSNYVSTVAALTADAAALAGSNGTHEVVWDMRGALPEGFASTNVTFTVAYLRMPDWCVIDLSGGADAAAYPVTYLDGFADPAVSSVPSVPCVSSLPVTADLYKTDRLAMRLVAPEADGARPFYCAVFETTQRQWELVTGGRPSYFNNETCYATRPVERVSWSAIRGDAATYDWPDELGVDTNSFVGVLRLKSGLASLDLPAEAQWEFACRAGTTTAYNNGSDDQSAMDSLGRYWDNGGSDYSQDCATDAGTAAVGSYLPNAWGLYDMHGNVGEWCLDRYSSSGPRRALRGGGWSSTASVCTSSFRSSNFPSSEGNFYGFRLVRTLSDDPEGERGAEAATGAARAGTVCAGSATTTITMLKDIAATVTFNNGSGAVVYDGQGHGVEVEVTDPADGAAVLFALGDSSGPTETFGPTAPMFTNACDATVWVEIAAEGYATVTNHADVTITNAPLTIAAKDQTYAYNGQTQGEGDTLYATPGDIAEKVAVSGLAPGDGLASIILDGQGTDPGTYPLVPSGATVTNAVGAYVTDNYAIGYTNGTLTIREPPPVVSNVVARQRWPWNGLVDVDYEISGYTAGLKAEIVFEEQGGTNRWTATKFLAGAAPTLNPGRNRATWDTAADGATNVVAEAVVATVRLVREDGSTPAPAAGTGKSVQLGAGALADGANAADPYGVGATEPYSVILGGLNWFIIAYDGKDAAGNALQYTPPGDGAAPTNLYPSGTATLLARQTDVEGNFKSGWTGNADYESSDLRTRFETYAAGLSDGERAAVTPRTFEGGGKTNGDPDYDENGMQGGAVENALLWPLSVAEAAAMDADLRYAVSHHGGFWNDSWWLRTPGINTENAAYVNGDSGNVSRVGEKVMQNSYAEDHPACFLDLSRVVLVSGAESGKEGEGRLKRVYDYGGLNWKLTVLDEARSGFAASYEGAEGDVWTIKYGGAAAGDNEWISAVVVDAAGVVTYYGRLVLAEEGDGNTITIDLAGKFNDGDALYVFNEQYNGDCKTDFSSALKAVGPPAAEASSATFRLDTREGPFESDGTETVAFSSLWHGTADSSVTLLANGEPFAEGLSGEGDYVWRALVNGTNVLTHVTIGVDNVPETATFIVKGLYPEPSATLRWKYAKNANGWFCAQVALTWHPSCAAGITNMRLLFADRYDAAERLSAYLVDPATVIDPVGTTETYRDIEYRVAPIDLDGFSDLGAGDRAVYGVSDETMASPLASVPKSERKICLRVPNRQLQTVGLFLGKQIAWLAWDDGGEPRFLPLVGSWDSAETETAQPAPQPDASFGAPLSRPASLDEANAAESFGLPLAAVATAEVTCRIASIGFGEDGSVTGTFEIAAEDAGRVVAEGGELTPGVKLAVLGAASLGGAFEPLDPAACGVELLSRKPPYAFRVKAPGPAAFFKVRLEAEDLFE